jgi:hypothetical protein
VKQKTDKRGRSSSQTDLRKGFGDFFFFILGISASAACDSPTLPRFQRCSMVSVFVFDFLFYVVFFFLFSCLCVKIFLSAFQIFEVTLIG